MFEREINKYYSKLNLYINNEIQQNCKKLNDGEEIHIVIHKIRVGEKYVYSSLELTMESKMSKACKDAIFDYAYDNYESGTSILNYITHTYTDFEFSAAITPTDRLCCCFHLYMKLKPKNTELPVSQNLNQPKIEFETVGYTNL